MGENKTNNSIILFDGVCNFCNASINFIIRHDKKNHFKFTPLQSEIGKKLLKKYSFEKTETESVVLFEDGKIFTKSTAALKLIKRLNGLYPLLYGFIIIPPYIRNAVYDLIARNRYQWFGKKESCMIPTEEIKNKFIF